MSTYLLINFLIILFPFLFSFNKRINFVSKIKPVALSILLIGGLFALWDVFAASRAHWFFNPQHVGSISLLGLPLEEWLFFVTVPYACLFVFESVKIFFKEKEYFKEKSFFTCVLPFLISFSLVIFTILFIKTEYTFLALLATALTISLVARFSDLFKKNIYWIYFVLTLGFFLIFNYILTSIPIITYGPSMIVGFRVLTIPIEDFFFNFSMLSLLLLVCSFFSNNKKK